MHAALRRWIEDRTVLLHATAEGQEVLYGLAMGFEITGEVRSTRTWPCAAPLVALAPERAAAPVGTQRRKSTRRPDARRRHAAQRHAAPICWPKVRRWCWHAAAKPWVSRSCGARARPCHRSRRSARSHQPRALIGHWCSRYAGKFLRIDVGRRQRLARMARGAGTAPGRHGHDAMVRNGPLERGSGRRRSGRSSVNPMG